ncbi:Integrase zinc binding domain [Popillia japonica]|uniref:Integrase zinc binding domain n=1 Tax=Popillia japonica TaxID=7064 RepID=A0AAW1MC97_POPJA
MKTKSASLLLTTEEIDQAEVYWIKITQLSVFSQEIDNLKTYKTVHKKSSIIKLTPFVDEAGILRIKSRLQESLLPFDTVNPIIFPKHSVFVENLIWKAHNRCFHSGINLALATIRKRFWIIHGRQRIKSVISKCVICKKLRCKPGQKSYAPLPRDRILMSKPFENAGVDFAGPLYVLDENNEKQKSYLMLQTCAVPQAVHLELVLDISTEGCLRGLQRFIARRGVPHTFYSDNAKTFKRASLELSKLYETLSNEEVSNFFLKQRIRWKFIVERTACWGGFWERMTKTVKDCLKFALRKSLICIDELQTIFTEIEATVNSRVLAPK